MPSDLARDVISECAKGEAGASKAKAEWKRGWSAGTSSPDFFCRTVARRLAPKTMTYEETANPLG
jgi:hypothetical protein